MASVVIQPCAGREARNHYAETIAKQVGFAAHATELAGHRTTLDRLYPTGTAPFWGVTPGQRNANVSKYSRAAEGDVVLFTGSRHAFAGGV